MYNIIIYAGIIYVNWKQASQSTIKITNLGEWHYGFQDKTGKGKEIISYEKGQIVICHVNVQQPSLWNNTYSGMEVILVPCE